MYDLSSYLKKIDDVISKGPYSDNWHSLAEYKVPEWYKNAKFGIFIHWGVFSVPAFGSEWYPRNMYRKDSPEYRHHVEKYGNHAEFGYKEFIPMFKAEKFNPKEWAELFADAGARYVVPVAEHHDGFQMYKSEISQWNSYEKGPCRDVLGELKRACNSLGMEVGASSHRAEHWFFLDGGKEFDSDIKEPLRRGDLYWPSMPSTEMHDIFSKPVPTEEYLQDWLVRTCEIVDLYRPKIIYFDGGFSTALLSLILKNLPHTITTVLMNGVPKLSSITSMTALCSALRFPMWKEVNLRRENRFSGKPIRRLLCIHGAIPRITFIAVPKIWFAIWWIL